MPQTPIQLKLVNLKEALCRIKQQQSNMTAFIDCLAMNLEALSEQVGEMEKNLMITHNTKSEGK